MSNMYSDSSSVGDVSKALSALCIHRKFHSSYNQSDTDTAGSDGYFRPNSHKVRQKRKQNCGYHSDNSTAKSALLPPIGVFWDIENCQVPRGRSAMCIAQMIRDMYFEGYREAEFVVVCDVRKETNQVIQELCDAQVNLIHVSSTSKNAADEKLRQCMRRFADTYGAPSAILLISGDVNFAADLSDLRHRKKIHVILLHKQNVSKALILCASEHHCFTELTNSIPVRATPNKNGASPAPSPVELAITNLPITQDSSRVKNRLKQLSDNCGGRVTKLDAENGVAVIRFPTDDHALRAQKRMDGEDVFGHKIFTQTSPWPIEDSSNRTDQRFRPDILDTDEGYHTTASMSMRCGPLSPMPPMPHLLWNKNNRSDTKRSATTSNTESSPQYRLQGTNFSASSSSQFNQNSNVDRNARSRSTSFNKHPEWSKSSFKVSLEDQAPDHNAPRSVPRKAKPKPNKNLNQARARSASPWQSNVQSQSSSNSSDIETQDVEPLFCARHCATGPHQQWALYNAGNMPNIRIGLKKLNENLCKLVESHNGSVPILSLAMCYSNALGSPLIIDQASGVPLEHLMLSCPGVSVKKFASGVKHIVHSKNDVPYEDFRGITSPDTIQQLQRLSNDFVILLRGYPKSLLLFDQFAQSYHNRFGKMCKVADSRCKKLTDLFEALPSIIQVLGEGSNRTVTLTHKVQKRLFASDLCRILRTQDDMKMLLSEFGSTFKKIIGRPFDITDYGVCFVSDMLEELNETVVVKKKLPNGDVLLSRPKKEQTEIEVQRMNGFKLEVIQLLTREPENTMLLNKFAPAFHQCFGRQCKLSDYGFDKLIELLEAISDLVEIIECSAGCNEQRKIRLKINKVHSNMFLPDEDLFSAPETLLMSPPPSQLPKPSLDLLAAPSCKDQDEAHAGQMSHQLKRRSRLAAIFPSTSSTDDL